jgi:hypothetical protein
MGGCITNRVLSACTAIACQTWQVDIAGVKAYNTVLRNPYIAGIHVHFGSTQQMRFVSRSCSSW